MSETSDPPDPDQLVEDPGEYNQRLRLQEISQARKTARRALSGEAQQAYGDQWELVALREVQNFARELEWLIRERSDAVYFNQELGTISFGPPEMEDFPENIKPQRVIGEKPEAREITISGLFGSQNTGLGFVNIPPVLSQSWTVNTMTRHSGPKDVSVTLNRTVPITITTQADSLCRRFINEAGLDARLEEKDPHGEL